LSVADRELLRGAAIVYGLPLASLCGGALLGFAVWGSDLGTAAGAAAALAAALAAAWACARLSSAMLGTHSRSHRRTEARMSKLRALQSPECHLCDAVVERLQPLLAGRSRRARNRRRRQQRGARAALRPRIPVLVAGELEISGYPLDEARVRQYLDSL